jgi:hypothetical protein
MGNIESGGVQRQFVYLSIHFGGMLTGKDLLVGAAAATTSLATLAALATGVFSVPSAAAYPSCSCIPFSPVLAQPNPPTMQWMFPLTMVRP